MFSSTEWKFSVSNDSCILPLSSSCPSLTYWFGINFTRNGEQQILKIYSKHLLLFGCLKKMVQIVNQIFLILTNLLLDKTHIMHDHGNL